MSNLKKYNQYVNEMIEIIKPDQSNDIPIENFTKKEIDTLNYNEGSSFELIDKHRAICIIHNKYRITIHKRKNDEFYYRIRDLKKSFNPIIFENKSKTLRDCLYNIDEFMWIKLKEDREEQLKNKSIEKDNDIFSGKSFSGKIHL